MASLEELAGEVGSYPAVANEGMLRKAAAQRAAVPRLDLSRFAPAGWVEYLERLQRDVPKTLVEIFGGMDVRRPESVTPEGVAGVVGALGPQAIVYHGSPHRFAPSAANPLGEFDSSKIGTGEGAQAYGHGVYIGESKSTGEFYRDAVSDAKGVQSTIEGAGHSIGIPKWAEGKVNREGVGSLINEWELRAARERSAMTKTNQPWINEANAIRFEEEAKKLREISAAGGGVAKGGGYLYKADLPDEHIAKMLDWDKPLSQQSAEVRAAANRYLTSEIENAAKGGTDPRWGKLNEPYSLMDEMTGDQFLQRLFHKTRKELLQKTGNQSLPASVTQKEISGLLREAGIPGIKYLDQGSRGAGDGTRNFVVFPGNESMLKILERQ